MKHVPWSLIPILLLAASCTHAPTTRQAVKDGDAEPFLLFKDGKPMTVIVAPADKMKPPGARMAPTSANRMMPADVPSDLAMAVKEFRRDLREGYGVELPLVISGEEVPAVVAALPNRLEIVAEDRPLLEEDETTITFPSDNVMRITGGQSGVRRSLFRLLEVFGGARYLFQGDRNDIGIGAHFPPIKTLPIPRETLTWTSAFPLHRSSIQTTSGSHWPGDGNRAYFWNWEARLGAKARVASAHMRVPFPLEKYAKAEEKPPEEIFPILHGKRYIPWKHPQPHKNYHHWQPRYSEPAAVDEAVKNILAYLRENPGVTSIALGVNDCGGHCETERGREVETYYRWVNAVAERVAKEFPDVALSVIAYREVQQPPKFKLHPNVIAILCFDMHSCMDPEVRAGREKLIEDWAKVAKIGHFGYNNGDHVYKLPRIYFGILRDMIKCLHENGGKHSFCERAYTTATEGPKMYLYFKLLENPDADVERIVQEWCDAAVGKEAAKPLRDYYAFWEDFWKTKAIHSSWWKSGKTNIYLPYSGFGSFMYGLESGDMAHCRELMEKVVELANAHGTEDQKKRADFLMRIFEWYEANAKAIGAEYVSPNGMVADVEDAVTLLKAVPEAQAAAEKSLRIPYETPGWMAPGLVTRARSPKLPEVTRGANADIVTGSMALTSNFMKDPRVQAELEKIANNKKLVPDIRLLANMLARAAKGDDAGNMVKNGSFEKSDDGWKTSFDVHGKISQSADVACDGDHSLKCEINHPNFIAQKVVMEAQPDTPYFFSARVFIPENQPVAEGRLNIRGSVMYKRPDGTLGNRNHTANIPDIVLKPGQWNYVSCTIPGASLRPDRDRGTDAVGMRIKLKNFEQGDVAYIDDIQLHPVAEEE